MALLNKRSRNIEGLLASRLGDQDAPRKIQDRGKHGALMSGNKVRYGTKGQEGRNFLKAVDKYYNKDNWGSGASSTMQGPSSPGKDRILGMLPDSEALDDFATDKASEEGGSPNWDNLPSIQHDSYKTNYSNPDELGPDSEALEEAAMDEASEMQMLADVSEPIYNAVPQAAGDERFMKEFAKKGKRVNEPAEEEGIFDMLKRKAGEGVDFLSGATAHKEGAEAAFNWKDPEAREKITNQTFIDASKKRDAEMQQWANLKQPTSGELNTAELDQPLGPDALDVEGRIDQSAPDASVAGMEEYDDDLGFAEPEAPGMWDKVKGLFASDEEGGGKKKKKMSKEAMKYGADLMQGMMKEPSQGQRQMTTSKVTRGSVPFAGLLAQKAPRQRNPYFTPKGLV